MIVAEASYEVSDPTVDSRSCRSSLGRQRVLQTSRRQNFASQAIRAATDIGLEAAATT